MANTEQVSQLKNSIQGQLEVRNRDMPFRMDNCGRKLIKATLSISLGEQKSRSRSLLDAISPSHLRQLSRGR